MTLYVLDTNYSLVISSHLCHLRFSKSDLIGTVIQPLRDADLFGVSMEREIDQRKGLLKVRPLHLSQFLHFYL